MALINPAKLKQYLNLGYNVLLSGEHGVGKTAIIKQAFEDSGLKWAYFSCSTLDPWVDLVGIPRIVEAIGNVPIHTELVRPLYLANDEVEAIYFDELNRAHPKVLNAIMEFIQFKAINGKKLKNLKVIWAAINPEDENDTYSVSHLDPAQIDRFQVQLQVPFEVDKEYFMSKYPTIGQPFLTWWNDIPKDLQKQVSPRRLDYAAHAFVNGCRIEDFLPVSSNPGKLRSLLKSISLHKVIKDVTTIQEAETLLKDINNATQLMDMVKSKDPVAIGFFSKYGKILPAELSAPFAEYVLAYNQGFEIVASLEELINKLPNKEGDASTAAFINNVSLANLYKNGGSLQKDLTELVVSQRNLVVKLANRMVDVLVKSSPKVLIRIMWGQSGKADNRPTNFQTIIKAVNAADPSVVSKAQKQFVNKKLKEKGVVDSEYFL